MKKESKIISNGVMLNAYPDSIGSNLSDTIAMLKMPEFKDVFSLFYVLPTFFNSDLDRGFSIIDYNLNKDLVSKEDLKALEELNIMLKFDIVLNHLSVASPQFKDLLKNGEKSKYKDFFINWNTFWEGNGTKNENDIVIPNKEFLDKLFMRKSGLPILKVPFPDGSEKPYWNTFYQNIQYNEISSKDISEISPQISHNAELICNKINLAITNNLDLNSLDFEDCNEYKEEILSIVNRKATYLGQMDVNAKSELVWEFYDETLAKVKSFGCKILRLDAFAYLHKEIGQTNFFNKPGTWNYLDRINEIAKKNDLILLPEIHAEYGLNLHNEVAEENYQIYDFFLPGLMIHTLETGNNNALLRWIYEIIEKDYKTVNMLGCHDGIPVLDLKGKEVNGIYNKGLLENEEIETIMNTIMDRGGRVKNLYDPSGKKISYYQINATFFSALGENEQKLLLARAIQMFMPGIPQVWYLDIFAGKNNYAAADKGGSGGHKEINRTTLTNNDIKNGLKSDIVINQLKIMRLRNTLKAFSGDINILNKSSDILSIEWQKKDSWVYLEANLKNYNFSISYLDKGVNHKLVF
ncbi:glycosidase [Polaribacter vadi]|uniref:alpha-amylase family glycosyl hydrolase n=1 Tax=Polaribacter TaxID=52959 RepID=UPI001C096B9D|nr:MULTISPECIES: glycosidase [Polaribacter]MBU3010594.1 glycosidase [Polaribacter vadi]MDO6740405.1 glycosidase [Polaribacter sp. 1_MG-2023]